MVSQKGQGATEYLVLFAVVLIIAMVVIALLGFFPSVGTGAKQSASESYWKSARPVMITSNFVASNGHFDITVQNSDSSPIKITSMYVATSATLENMAPAAEAITLGTGDSSNITLSAFVPAAGRCTNGTTYEYYVSFGYTQGSYSFGFNGTKPIIGKCG